jgi:hypothetical protein
LRKLAENWHTGREQKNDRGSGNRRGNCARFSKGSRSHIMKTEIARVMRRTAIIFVSIILAIGAIGGAAYFNLTIPSDGIIRFVDAKSYAPQVEIRFDDKEDGERYTNPSKAELVLIEGSVETTEWTITSETGAVQGKGEGTVVQKELKTLTSGQYTLTWKLTDDEGLSAYATRDFFISKTVR